MTNPLKNVCENANTLALGGVSTFAKEKLLGLNWINLEKREVFQCTLNYRMALDLEFYIDPLCFGSNMQVGCVSLLVSFPKCPRSSNSEFGAKSYNCFSIERSVTGLYDLRVQSAPASPVTDHSSLKRL